MGDITKDRKRKATSEKDFAFKRSKTKPHVNIGTIGHVDSGKTTLTAALTLVQNKQGLAQYLAYENIDNAPMERSRGVTINVSHVNFETEKRSYSLSDCPGHADYIKNMIAGVSQLNGAILVVASDKGMELQGEAHLHVLRALGIPNIVVLVNDKTVEPGKSISQQKQEELEAEIRYFLEEHNYDTEEKKTPIVFASAYKIIDPKGKYTEEEKTTEREKLLQLIRAVDEHITIPESKPLAPLLLYIEGKYRISGHGTIAVGKVKQGTIKVGDKVILSGLTKKTGEPIIKEAVVKKIEQHHEELESAGPRADIGINLKGVEFDEVHRGQALTTGNFDLCSEFEASIYLHDTCRNGLQTGFRPQFYIWTADVTGTIVLPADKAKALPGETFRAIIKLIAPLVINTTDTFIIRQGGEIIGTGVVTKLLNVVTKTETKSLTPAAAG